VTISLTPFSRVSTMSAALKCKDYPYGTHLPVLAEYILKTQGPILEIGAGKFSTPFLRIFNSHRIVITVEQNPLYIDNRNGNYVKSVADALACCSWFDVILIDGPMPRRPVVEQVAPHGRFIIMHDTEQERFYDYPFNLFKYRRDYKELSPWTTVCTNHDW
jgi:hypothetical protein